MSFIVDLANQAQSWFNNLLWQPKLSLIKSTLARTANNLNGAYTETSQIIIRLGQTL